MNEKELARIAERRMESEMEIYREREHLDELRREIRDDKNSLTQKEYELQLNQTAHNKTMFKIDKDMATYETLKNDLVLKSIIGVLIFLGKKNQNFVVRKKRFRETKKRVLKSEKRTFE